MRIADVIARDAAEIWASLKTVALGTTASKAAAGDHTHDVSAMGALTQGANLSDLDSAATARTNLGLGTAATTDTTAYATSAQGTLADTAVQPVGTPVANQIAYWTTEQLLAASTVTTTELDSLTGIDGNVKDQLDGKLDAANNLSDVASKVTARANLGLGYMSWPQELPDSGRFATLTDPKSLTIPFISYTKSTLSIVAATATITDSSGLIPVASFPVGNTVVNMSGWSNSANNNVQLRVASVSATTLVLEGDGVETLVDEAEGASVTLRGVILANTSGMFSPYAGSTIKNAGAFLFNNTTFGGTAGALAPKLSSLITAMGRTGNSARYGVEFAGPVLFTSGTANAAFWLNNGRAWFGNWDGIGTLGYWIRRVSATAGPYILASPYADVGAISVDGGEYVKKDYVLPDEEWHYIKAYVSVKIGYQNANAGVCMATAAGQQVLVALPFWAGCVPPADAKWSVPLIVK